MPTESFPEPRSIDNAIEKIITHEGMFHTDDVFATAILKDIFPEYMKLSDGEKMRYVEYIRSRDNKVLGNARKSESEMLVDVGGQNDSENVNFDHHQEGGAGARENGIEYASAGLVWKQYGKEWIKYIDTYTRMAGKNTDAVPGKDIVKNIENSTGVSQETPNLSEQEIDIVWNQIDKNYVQYIDSNDTGQLNGITYSFADGHEVEGGQFALAEIVRLANVDCHDGRSQYKRFSETVETFRNMTLGMVNKYIDVVEAVRNFDPSKCEFSNEGKTVVINEMVLPQVAAYLLNNKPEFKDVQFYGAVNNKKEYSISAAAVSEGSRRYRNPNKIPQELRLGNNSKAINEVLGIEDGVIFVHNAGFLASCKNLESTKKLLDYCVNK